MSLSRTAMWQSLINLAAKTLGQPHALLTMLDENDLHVLLHNSEADDTFITNNCFPLGLGVYCETTMSGTAVNYVPNALDSSDWNNNPSIDFSLISYVGLATRWPDGEVFGTICGLGDKPLHLDDALFETITLFKSIVETDLQLLFEEQKHHTDVNFYTNSISEMHHRVKNHLNMITGLMQLENTTDIQSKEEFVLFQNKIHARIQAVSELHNMLAYRGQQSTNLGEYLSKILKVWTKTNQHGTINIIETLDDVILDENQIIYFGIILNELITNSFRHAFPGHSDPRIILTLEDLGNSLRLGYQDNGPGLPANFDLDAPTSLGMSLVSELTTHMNGTLSTKNDPGATFVFTFNREPA